MAKMGYTQAQQEGAWEGQGLSSNSSMRRVKMGHWSPDEDNKLTNYIMRNGLRGCWNYIAKQAGLQRCGKSCRLRWINYLRPGLKRGSLSSQEELLIIHLQSTLGNRWSQIAAHLPGRTDNEIKNYWYSAIKKKRKLKNEPPFSNTATNEDKNIKSNFPFQSDIICNADSMTAHVHDIVSSSHSAQPYLEVMQQVEEYQQHNNTFNILLAAGENQLCVPGELEFKQEAQNQSDKSFIYTDPIHTTLISPGPHGQGLYNYKSARSSTWEDFILESCRTTVPLHEVPGSANDYFMSSPGINNIPALVERQTSKGKNQNNGHINETEIMKDYSLFTASSGISVWSPACHYYSNIAADFADACSDVSYSDELLGDRVMEDFVSVHDEKSGHQPYSPLNFVSQVSAPSIKGDNNLDAGDDWKDRRNLGYDANSMYCDINSTWQRNHQIEGGGIGDQLDHTKFSMEKANRKPIPAIFGEGSVALESGAGQVTAWEQEDMCNINTAAASCPDRISFS